MRNSYIIFVLTVFCVFVSRAQIAVASSPKYTVSAKGIVVKLSASGEIIGLSARGREVNITGQTCLDDCTQVGAAKEEKLSGNAIQFTRILRDSTSGRTLTVVDRFKPGKYDSVRWEVEVVSEGKPWTTAITTKLNYPATSATRFWTAWSDPVWTNWSDPDKRTAAWHDPLVFRPLANVFWTYGGRNTSADHIVLPLATFAEPAEDFGLSIVFSPADTILCGSRLTTTQSGTLQFSRVNYRLGGGKPVHFEMNLVAHEADWRGGLRWMTARYPQFFEPPNPQADEMAGCAAYSGDEDPINVAKFKKMAFRINWKLCDDCPYLGMFIPPVTNADERWERQWPEEPDVPDKPHWTSARRMNDYALYLKTNGFFLLDYFNVAEFGRNMVSNSPTQTPGVPLWENPRAFLAKEFPDALLSSKPVGYGAWVVDFGNPDYQKFLLEQADRDIRWLPDSAGICIDRTDYLEWNDTNADDGVSWVNGRPLRSLCIAWDDLLSKLGPIMHKAGKVIFASPLYSRLDVYRQIDGFYDEYGYDGRAINGTALMGLDKPVMTWTYNESVFRPDPDSFFQRHLLMGAYPTAPYPWNNHCILPDMSWDDFYFKYRYSPLFNRDTGHRWIHTEKYYLAYGPLLDAMRGKKWVLAPHCVTVVSGLAKVNLFQVPGGYAMPVCFGGKAEYADVMIRNVPDLGSFTYSVIQPGVETTVSPTILFKDKEGAIMLRVPLVHGCAMVTLRK